MAAAATSGRSSAHAGLPGATLARLAILRALLRPHGRFPGAALAPLWLAFLDSQARSGLHWRVQGAALVRLAILRARSGLHGLVPGAALADFLTLPGAALALWARRRSQILFCSILYV